jgi:hypothetical protein
MKKSYPTRESSGRLSAAADFIVGQNKGHDFEMTRE